MNHTNLAVVLFFLINTISTNASLERKKNIIGVIDLYQDVLAGTWRGKSVCVDKASGCHDEEVIYHITHDATSDRVEVDADRIVDGKAINMGSLVFTYDKAEGTLSSKVGRNTWQFKIKEKQMQGVLLREGEIFRNVLLNKD